MTPHSRLSRSNLCLAVDLTAILAHIRLPHASMKPASEMYALVGQLTGKVVLATEKQDAIAQAFSLHMICVCRVYSGCLV